MGLGGRDYEDYEETSGNDEYAHSPDCGGFTFVCVSFFFNFYKR